MGAGFALARVRRKPKADEVVIVDDPLVPTRDRAVAASSKNYRYSASLQVLVHADTRLVLAICRPLPGNRNDCTAFTESGIDSACGKASVLADGAYQGTGTLIPRRRRAGQERLAGRLSASASTPITPTHGKATTSTSPAQSSTASM